MSPDITLTSTSLFLKNSIVSYASSRIWSCITIKPIGLTFLGIVSPFNGLDVWPRAKTRQAWAAKRSTFDLTLS